MASQVFREGVLDGQVAIVTGGGSGIGRATALELAGLGAEGTVCGRRGEPLEETPALDRAGRSVTVHGWPPIAWSLPPGGRQLRFGGNCGLTLLRFRP